LSTSIACCLVGRAKLQDQDRRAQLAAKRAGGSPIGLLGLLAPAFDRHFPHGLSLEPIQARNGRNCNNAPARSEFFSVSPRFLGSRGRNPALKTLAAQATLPHSTKAPRHRAAKHLSGNACPPIAWANEASRRTMGSGCGSALPPTPSQRNPRRPVPPTLAHAAFVCLPGDEGRDVGNRGALVPEPANRTGCFMRCAGPDRRRFVNAVESASLRGAVA
jgi:hypothetical protein